MRLSGYPFGGGPPGAENSLVLIHLCPIPLTHAVSFAPAEEVDSSACLLGHLAEVVSHPDYLDRRIHICLAVLRNHRAVVATVTAGDKPADLRIQHRHSRRSYRNRNPGILDHSHSAADPASPQPEDRDCRIVS